MSVAGTRPYAWPCTDVSLSQVAFVCIDMQIDFCGGACNGCTRWPPRAASSWD